MDKLLEYSRTGLKMHLAAYHTDGNEKSFNKYSIARNLQPTNLKKVYIIEKLVKSRYSEKATKFEKILHLEFDATH